MMASDQISITGLLTGVATVTQVQWDEINWLARWMIMVRAVVLVLTINAALVGVCLALASTSVSLGRVFAVVFGLTLAHATNNLINDWVDHLTGVDKENYFRRQYGTHVLKDGLVSTFLYGCITLFTGGLALTCAAYVLHDLRFDQMAIWLTIAGGFFLLFYTWPLKHLALGELSVLLVWGPLIAAGTFYVLTETMNPEVLLISIVVGVGPALVILGKHMDKHDHDLAARIRTLPVVIGLDNSVLVSRFLIGVQWLTMCVLFAYYQMFAIVLCLLALKSLRRLNERLKEEPPDEMPDGYPVAVWPLWYSATAFSYSRDFSAALLVSLIIEVFVHNI